MAEFAIFRDRVTTVYEKPEETKETEKGIVSAISDEALYGGTCRILKELGDWSYILSYYGYAGYVRTASLMIRDEEEIREYLSRPLGVICGRQADVLNLPAVQGICLLTLGGGALVELLERQPDGEPGTVGIGGKASRAAGAADGSRRDGWTRVRLLDGRIGYIPARFVEEKRFGEDYLWKNPEEVLADLQEASKRSREAAGGAEGFSLERVLDTYYGGSEEAFRDRLVQEAFSYLGTQYRWGGRSADGIDCSGLVSMAYMRSGVLIYRDAAIAAGYAMERIPAVFDEVAEETEKEEDPAKKRGTVRRFSLKNLSSGLLRTGDALYFPGHIAMYIGNGRYIHSTARAGSNGVVVNSLVPGDPDYREDLLRCLYAVGGVRTRT